MQQVAGLKWGYLLGSPDAPEPVVVWEKVYDSRMPLLVPLQRIHETNEVVFGLPEKSCILAQHNQQKQKGKTVVSPFCEGIKGNGATFDVQL